MKKIFMMLAIIMLAIPTLATDWSGEGVIGVVLDKTDDYNFNTSLDYLGLGADSETFSFYGTFNNLEANSEFTFNELYGKFNLFDTDFSIGRVFAPMGVNMKFDRPSASVFLSSPRNSLYDEGITATAYEGFATVEGFFGSKDYWTMRTSMEFLNGGLLPSITFMDNNFEEVEKIFACEFIYESLMLNASVMGEYWMESEDAWMRGVLTPGIFDRVAVFGGYYDTGFIEDTFTYGVSFEVNEGIEVSTEWTTDDSFTPMVLQVSAKF
jgi:hypothetical protein